LRRIPLAFALGALLDPAAALADEGGGSFWVPGQYASFAASKTESGWSVDLETYVATGRQSTGSIAVARGGTRVQGRVQTLDIFYVTPGYTFDTAVLDGQLYVGATFGYGWVDNKVDSVLSRPLRRSISLTETNVDEAGWGTVDINPLVTLKWELGVHNLMVYATGNIPTGYFDPNTISTPGLGFWAVDGGLGYTYDGGNGLEFSVVAGATYNFENPWSWQSGVDGHVDVGASWMIADPFYIGAVGYLFKQLSGDVGAPTDLAAHLSRVAGAGPQAGWSFRTGTVEVDVNVRAYAEFAAENRPQGYAAWFTVTLQQIKPKVRK
jgi:hypothetical protein